MHFLYYTHICQAKIIMIYLKRQEYVNKNYVQINQYLWKKIKRITTKGKKRNIEAQKREQRHRQVKGEFAYMVIPKRDKKNKCGSYWMGKRRKPEETADIKSQVRERL